jgi:stage II sporulation protein D
MPGSGTFPGVGRRTVRRIGAAPAVASTLVLLLALGFGPVAPVLAGGPRPAQSFPPTPSGSPSASSSPTASSSPGASDSPGAWARPSAAPAPSAGATAAVPVDLPVSVAATPRALPAPSRITPVNPIPITPGSVTFYGRGYGHGLGMSQYGARGRALAGQTAPTILAHYYEHTTMASVSSAAPVRVLVLSPGAPTATNPIVLHGRGAPFTFDGVGGTFPIGARAEIWRSGNGFGILINSATGAVLLHTTSTIADLRFRAGADPGRIQVDSKPSAYDTYRGTIRILAISTGVIAVNELGLDLYLRGVVPAEMPAAWPTEALRAQAIASRSYAEADVHVGIGAYDLFDDSRAQVYRGALGEVMAGTNAVTGTAGQVLKSGSTIITALYHSADGGATENNENVYTSPTGQIVSSPLSYLRGSSDRDPKGVSYDSASPHATWHSATYTWAQLSAIFATDPQTNVGSLTSLDLSAKGVSGRLIRVLLVGSKGSKTVSGETFRTVFNTGSPAADPYIWSTLVDTAPIP